MNIVEFSDQIGISRTTVYRAITGKGRISVKTREFILDKAKELGLKPSRSAQALRTGRTHLVELWIPNLEAPYSGFILAKLQLYLSIKGFDLIVRSLDENAGIPQYLHRNSLWSVEGILTVDVSESTLAFLRATRGQDVPIVNMGGNYLTPTDFVGIDNYSGAVEATRHLIQDARCKKLTFVVETQSAHHGNDRYDAVIDVAGDAGVDVDLMYVERPIIEQGLLAMQEYLDAHGHPDGVLCFNDSVAMGVQSALLLSLIHI